MISTVVKCLSNPSERNQRRHYCSGRFQERRCQSGYVCAHQRCTRPALLQGCAASSRTGIVETDPGPLCLHRTLKSCALPPCLQCKPAQWPMLPVSSAFWGGKQQGLWPGMHCLAGHGTWDTCPTSSCCLRQRHVIPGFDHVVEFRVCDLIRPSQCQIDATQLNSLMLRARGSARTI